MNQKRAGNTLPTELPNDPSRRFGGVTLRSVFLGLCCVIFVAAYAPYNDFALNNTYFIGNHFPIGVTLMMCIFILGLNPLLRWFNPKVALRSSELITIWAMCLVGAAFPTAGLLRQLIPWIIAPIYLLPHHPEWQAVLDFLPDSLFPTKDPTQSAIVTKFYLGTDEGTPLAVPWGAWAKPLALWALYFVPFFVGILLLSVLLSRQWIVQEKLQYPIATVMLEMVRDAPAGKRFNAIFTDRRMWIGAGIVMTIHLINGLHAYFAKVPRIPLGFNLSSLFTEGIWANNIWYMETSTVYFSMLGIAFLMASEVSLSLWFFMVLYGTIIAFMRYQGFDPWEAMRSQSYGAILAMGGYLLFLARSHLWRAFRTAFGFVRDQRDRDYVAYRWVVWGLILCIIACITWLCATGMPLPVAVAQIIILYLVYLVMSRLVAETGMFFVLPRMWTEHLFQLMLPHVIAAKSNALVIMSVFPSFYPRETLMPFAFNALRLGHEITPENSRRGPSIPTASGRFVSTLIASILVSLVVAGAVSIALYYSRGAVRTNQWIGLTWSSNQYSYMANYLNHMPLMPGQGPGYMALGAGLIVLLGICRLRFARWPFVPIALCMATSDALGYIWFSIFIGWVCKTSVMRIGGVSIYNRLRPVFLGMVIGEVLMAGVWMAVGAVVRISGFEIGSVRILPG